MEDERRALAARMTDKAAKLLLDMPLRQMRRLEECAFMPGKMPALYLMGAAKRKTSFFRSGTWTSW